MEKLIQEKIQAVYGWQVATYLPVGSGLINHTLKVEADGQTYICQQINTQVFRKPELIDENLRALAAYFSVHVPGYLFTAPVSAKDGQTMCRIDSGYYRVFEWVKGSHTVDVLANPGEAFEAANQFGLFTSLLKNFTTSSLGTSLPDFHNLSLRFHQFEQALQNGMQERIRETADAILFLQSNLDIVKRYEAFVKSPEVKVRVTHHDTKISNILFDNEQKGICVIDLDTVMPGYFISDVGDMFRTYVCPVSEEEKDLSKIFVRKEFLQAIEKGYLLQMGSQLSAFEKDHLYFGGEVLIYMQALRFLSDYLVGDTYYGSRYPGHNYVRAANQIRLLEAFREAL